MGLLVFQQSSGGTINVQGTNTASAFTWTIPASTDTFVGLAATQTLTNKTLTSPVISGGTIDNAVIGGTTAVAGSFTTVTAGTSVTTPFVTSAAATNLLLKSAGTTAVTIDTAQNVGVGVTPSSWGSPTKGFQIGATTAVSDSGTGNSDFKSNSYYNAGDKYIGNGYSSMLRLVDGQFKFFNAGNNVSGAGASCAYTQAMTLDASGYLYLNTTSKLASGTTSQLQINSSAGLTNSTCAVMQDGGTAYNTGAQYILFSNSSGATSGYIYHSASTAIILALTSDKRLKTDDGIVTDVSYLDKTQIHDFTWTQCGTKDRGIFAQDEYENNPRNIQVGKDDLTEDGNIKNPWTVNYTGYIPDLIVYCQQLKKTVQELSAQVTTLQTQVTALQTKVGV